MRTVNANDCNKSDSKRKRGTKRERERKERTIDRYNTKMESLGNWPAQSLTVQGN